MALAFRNVTTDPASHVSSWPLEAVRTALERGDLDDWHRLAREIAAQPWGRTARQVEEVLRADRPYGTTELMEEVIARARQRAAAAERETVALELRRALARSRLTRAEFASRLGTSSSRLSTYLSGKVTPAATLMVRLRHVIGEPPATADHQPDARPGDLTGS